MLPRIAQYHFNCNLKKHCGPLGALRVSTLKFVIHQQPLVGVATIYGLLIILWQTMYIEPSKLVSHFCQYLVCHLIKHRLAIVLLYLLICGHKTIVGHLLEIWRVICVLL